jgi:PAS domain-containing protein
MSTKFAPAGRAGTDELERQRGFFQENDVLDMFLGKIPAVFIIINKHRQIVYMNKGALEFSGLEERKKMVAGRRKRARSAAP